MISNSPRKICTWLIVLATTCITSPLWAQDHAYKALVDSKASAYVTIKFVLKISGGGPMMSAMGDQESETEVTGVMIDPKGVIICSNTQLGGFMSMMKRFAGPMAGDMSATPTDIKVLIGDDIDGVDATLIARDTELDLAWIRVNKEGSYQHLDMSKSTTANVGDPIIAMRRMGRYFARTLVVAEGHIGGITNKPRRLYVPSGNVATGVGLPVYAQGGAVIGILITQMPDTDSMSSGNPMAMMGNMMGMQDSFGGLILPADKVVRATQRALQSDEDPK